MTLATGAGAATKASREPATEPAGAVSTQAVVESARRSGIHLRELGEPVETVRGSQLLQAVWGGTETVGPANWLRTVQKTGGYVFGAYDEGGVLLGVSLGLLSTQGLHSHITGVIQAGQRRGIGLALKQHQRAWCLEHGITTVTWTCDPLVRRNVAFNLHALGATVEQYVPDYYGPMADGVNADDETDRLSFRWDLLSARAVAAQDHRLPWVVSHSPQAVGAADGLPVVHAVAGGDRLVHLPADIERLRRTEPEVARAWRLAVREGVMPGLAAGATITGLTAEGSLVLEAGR
jgi:predicted GNAT superfamily acetyltransferase